MRLAEIAMNLATGALCRANVLLAVTGLTATFTLKDWAQVFAGLATGCWFTLQIVLAVRDRMKKRRERNKAR